MFSTRAVRRLSRMATFFQKAVTFTTGQSLRTLFTTALLFVSICNQSELWNKFQDYICNNLKQCSQRGSPSVLSQDGDGRLFAIPSCPPAKLHDDCEQRTSVPGVPYHYINPSNVSAQPFDSFRQDMSFETKRQELRLHKIVRSISTSSLSSLSRLPLPKLGSHSTHYSDYVYSDCSYDQWAPLYPQLG